MRLWYQSMSRQTEWGGYPRVLRGILDPTTLEDLAGTIDVAVNVESPSTNLEHATGDLTLTRLDLQMGGLPVTQRVPTRIVLKDGFARIESWNWAGADLLAEWFHRNIRIYSNVMGLIDSPNERVLVIYGAGHLGWLRNDFAGNPNVRLRKLSEFVRVSS